MPRFRITLSAGASGVRGGLGLGNEGGDRSRSARGLTFRVSRSRGERGHKTHLPRSTLCFLPPSSFTKRSTQLHQLQPPTQTCQSCPLPRPPVSHLSRALQPLTGSRDSPLTSLSLHLASAVQESTPTMATRFSRPRTRPRTLGLASRLPLPSRSRSTQRTPRTRCAPCYSCHRRGWARC